MKQKFNPYKITAPLLTIFIFCISNTSFAQQDPESTQYLYNMSILNPAYATDDPETINLGAFYRAQWVGAVGGPTTGMFFAHTPIAKKMEGGISIVHDEIGDVVRETNVFLDYAYVLTLNDWSKLSFGIKAGATFFSTNYNGFIYSDPEPDPAFSENLSRTFPNIGMGAFFFGENFYAGLSAPNLLKSKHLEKDSGIVALGKEEIHFFLTGGYIFELDEKWKLKPNFMTKAVGGAPLSMDLNANILYNDRLEFGLGYRFGDAMNAMVNFKINRALRIGYAYDHTVSNLGRFNNGTHEIMLLFDIDLFGMGMDKSPRFF